MSEQEPGVLPTGWVWSTADALSQKNRSISYGVIKLGEETPGGIPVLRSSNVRHLKLEVDHVKRVSRSVEEPYRRTRLEGGEVLVTVRGTLGGVACAPREFRGFNISREVARIALINESLGPVVTYFIASPDLQTWLLKRTRGITYSGVNIATLKLLPIPVPPLSEQGRIVEALDSHLSRLDDAQASLERVQQNLKRYRASVLSAAVEGRLVPTEAELARKEGRDYEPASVLLERILEERRRRWEEAEVARLVAKAKPPKNDKWKAKYKVPVAPDAVELPELPEGWCWATVGQLGEVVTGTTPSTKRPDFYGGTVPFLKPTDLDAGLEVSTARQFLSAEGSRHARLLPPGSVLVTCIGATIGKTGYASVACATNQQINAVVGPRVAPVTSFLYWYFCSPFGQDSVISNSSSTTLPIINKGRFERLPVPVPPIAEQERIAAELERQQSVVSEVTRTLAISGARIARTRQAILKWAFEGKLVDQKPDDEPAELLLERIRAEREKVSGKPKRRGRRKARKTE